LDGVPSLGYSWDADDTDPALISADLPCNDLRGTAAFNRGDKVERVSYCYLVAGMEIAHRTS